MDLDGCPSNILPMDPILQHSFGVHFLSHITSFIDNSRKLYVPGSIAIQQAFNWSSKFAAALIPPMNDVSPDLLAAPLETGVGMDESPCEVQGRGCGDLALENFCWTRNAVERTTGIKFPTILDNIEAGEKTSSFASEVLVGTGSRIMKILKIKSLKVYAFGFYIHPPDICEKLGPKYASIPLDESNKHREFYDDLLREDISMSIRLVVSCNGIKINSVKDAFEKSLRARLVKANPNTDYHCLKAFGSLFSQDIPLQVGTIINFRRTTDGDFITEIGDNHVGAVHSKDLCRAFFDMYIGDLPVCEQAKEEIGKNVASIMMRRC